MSGENSRFEQVSTSEFDDPRVLLCDELIPAILKHKEDIGGFGTLEIHVKFRSGKAETVDIVDKTTLKSRK